MSKIVSRFSFLFIALLLSMVAVAQDNSVQMADTMRSNGKIYIVVAVCLTILIGLFLYVMTIDRKMSRIERNKDAE